MTLLLFDAAGAHWLGCCDFEVVRFYHLRACNVVMLQCRSSFVNQTWVHVVVIPIEKLGVARQSATSCLF